MLVRRSMLAALLLAVCGCGGGGGSIASPDNPLWVATDVVIADIDGDGLADLLTSAQYATGMSAREGRIVVQRQTPAGGFGAAETYAVGRYPWRLRAVDLDGDGAVDLLATDVDQNVARWLRQDPTDPGRFLAPATLVTDVMAYDVVAGDFDGDGMLDVAVADDRRDANRIVVVSQRASEPGVFDAPTAVATPGSSSALASADIDGDGRDDLAAWIATRAAGSTTGSGRLGYLLQEAAGGLGQFVQVAARKGLNGARVTVADYLGDGGVGLIAFLTPQDAGYHPEILVALRDPGSGDFPRRTGAILSGTRGTDDAAFADFDGDTWIDAAVAGFFPVGSPSIVRSRVNLFRQAEEGALVAAGTVELPASVSRVAAGDIDGDGRADLALYAGERLLVMFQSASVAGEFEAPIRVR